jgi:hypothetical protein
MMRLEDFRQVWLVDFAFEQPAGERPRPVCLTASEWRGRREVRLEQGSLRAAGPPYPLGPDALVVAYDAPAQLGCHLALGWSMPAHVLNLHAEFRCLTSGLDVPGGHDLPGALAHFGLRGGGPEALTGLLDAMRGQLGLPRALIRGRYTAAVARMEGQGVPLDGATYDRLRAGWGPVRDCLVREVDRHYGVFQGGKLSRRLWRAWVNRHRIPWPRHPDGPRWPRLDLDTFRDMAEAYPQVGPMKELQATLALLRPAELAVGADGRARCPLRPFCSKTGRNQPSTTRFIFGPATWVRGLIKPAEGWALAYVDYEQQEFGIAAALSGDANMQEAYRSGDPYLAFAIQAGAVPPDATKDSHRLERDQFKLCALRVQYGMGARSLAVRLGGSLAQARELLGLYRRTYATYWRWSREVGRRARADGKVTATFGWTLHVGQGSNPRSVKNFPLQANGAEMLRLACCKLTEEGVGVCAPVHDALLVEAPAWDIDRAVEACERAMRGASEYVLSGFPLRTDAKVVRFPDRYMDPRGRAMWEAVLGLLDGAAVPHCA